MKNACLLLLLLLVLSHGAMAQEPKASAGPFALINATIETVTQGTQRGTLLIRGGLIEALGEEVTIPEDAEVIDCAGLTLYPGLIDGGNHVGLSEVGSIDLTQDYDELGDITPQAQALTAVNPNSVVIPITRTNGVTTGLTMPDNGLFPGTAALINFHGYTPEQMSMGFQAPILNFPTGARRSRYDRRSDEDIAKARKKALEELASVWEKVAAYHRIDSLAALGEAETPAYYPEMAALLPAYRGESKLLIEVNAAQDIEEALKWVKQQPRVSPIFMGVSEGWRVAKALAEAKVPVITGPVLSLPTREYDRYDRPYANAGLMHAAGVTVALRTNDTENARNLPYQAGFAAAYGLGREEALRAVTIVPAQLFGVADQLGSLEVGKQATLFAATGDPFEPQTQIAHVFIAGWLLPQSSRQIRLYEEFLERSPGVDR
jgi:imidazolonepropionase-like amidohydrolase